MTNQEGSTYSGRVYRNAPDGFDPLEIGEHNIGQNHRYTEPGFGGQYFGTDESVVNAECAHYGTDTGATGRTTYEYDVTLDNMLDLADPNVRHNLGVSYESITGNDYSYTHMIGRFAQSNGYDGIIAPSARQPGGVNVVVFDTGGIS